MTKPTPLFRGAYTTGKVELDRLVDQIMDAVNDVRGQGGASEATGDRRTNITVVGGSGTTGESAGAQRILNNSGVPVPKGALVGQTATGALGLALAGTLAAQLVATETAAPGAWMAFAQTGLVFVLVETGVAVGAGETAYLSGAEAGRATNSAPGTPQRIGVFHGTAASSGLVLLLVDGLGGAGGGGGGEHDAVTLDTPADTVLSLTEQVIGLDTQTANKVLAGPATGAAAAPTFRDLVDADIPAAIARDTEVTGAISTHAAIAAAHHTNANDPSAGEKGALAGTSGTPGAENKYVTNADSRNTDARTPAAHVLVSASHTASALTAGHFLKALTETTFGFAAHGLSYGDVGAAASGHGHSHTALTDIGTNTHAQIDTFIGSKGAASGLASLDGSSKVVQDPANATATPTQNKIPIADGAGGTLALGWLPATLTGKTATPAAHALTNSVHAETGLTTGHFLKATSATAFGFGAHGLGYSDVGAAAASHAHAIGDLPTAATVTDGDDTHVPTNHAVYTAIAGMGGHAAVTLDANADSLLSLSTQALGLDTQTANKLFGGPASGAAAVPAFRDLVNADIPSTTITAGKLSASATNILFGRSTAGAGAGEEIACTVAGRALLDDAAASDQRMTLGIAALMDATVLTTQHYHSALAASDGNPNPALQVSAAGNVGILKAPLLPLHVLGTSAAPATSGTTPTGISVLEGSIGVALYIGSGIAWPYPMFLQTAAPSALQTIIYPLALQPNGGSVGIGCLVTDLPYGLLDVNQGTSGPGTVATNGTTTLTGTNTRFLNTFKVGDTLTVSGETVRTIATIASNTSLTVSSAFSTTASSLTYTLTGGTRFCVRGNGQVGINNTAPTAALDVTGAAKISSTLNAGATTLSGALAMGANAITSTGTNTFGPTTVKAPTNGGTALSINTTHTLWGSGDDVALTYYQAAYNSTDGNSHLALSIPIPADSIALLQAQVTAVDKDSPASGDGFTLIASYSNDAGAAVLIGSVTQPYHANATSGWTATFTLSDTSVIVEIKGATGKNVHWAVTATRHVAWITIAE